MVIECVDLETAKELVGELVRTHFKRLNICTACVPESITIEEVDPSNIVGINIVKLHKTIKMLTEERL